MARDVFGACLLAALALAGCGSGQDDGKAAEIAAQPAPAANRAAPAPAVDSAGDITVSIGASTAMVAGDTTKVDARQAELARLDSTAAAREDSVRADSLRRIAEIDVPRETFVYAGGSRDPFASLINVAKVGPELVDLQLVGIYQDLRYSANSVAVLREKATGKRHKLRSGDRLGRLRVAQVRAQEVVFAIQDFGFERQETLSLRKQEDETP